MSESGDRSDPDEVQPGDESTVYPDPVHSRQELAAAEKRVAGQIDPGMRAVVVAAVVVVVAVSFSLPHNGGANGWQVLAGSTVAQAETITLPSRIFLVLAAVFGIVLSMLALVTRRWVLAWFASAGCTLAIVFGVLAVWSRQTLDPVAGGAGPGIGLFLGWGAMTVLAYHWIKVVWARSSQMVEAEAARRAAESELPEQYLHRLPPPREDGT
ncbi:hypothetical protein IM25_24345 (plasmid) [Rhodococcus sp. p52]|uniref:Rv2732c family membrane protein n=1 Tax=Rhodococcus TaxID=1827 RepID=UPI00051A5880|nr:MULTISPECIES: hypothetical protein [Rhodococcus]AOD24870.1 hypothetical protein IM25_24345 [Rhodococcus sp. p52]QOH59707.1 hypothetical protein C6Y44_26780 [Rhodococcus rhodochrous]UTM39907.1 hypothetical protein MX572_24320 [Rhodococcus pyridinivorans]